MTDFETILKLSSDKTVELGKSFKDVLHKKLILGQSRYVCRYGTLSDGHEKITDAQRYFQAIKEMYFLANNISSQKVLAMRAQADLEDAEIALKAALDHGKNSDTLRAQASVLEAKTKLMSSLVTIEDQLRMLDEYNKIRLELEPIVESKYPEGIEQAEKDNWEAVFTYRMIKSQMPWIKEQTANIPLDPVTKAELGAKYGRLDAVAPLLVTDENKGADLLERVQREQEVQIKKLEAKHG